MASSSSSRGDGTANPNSALDPPPHDAGDTPDDDVHTDGTDIEHNQDIELDTGSDNDSAYAGSVNSSTWTASLTSSIQHFREENGRTYHSYRDGKYILPNDDSEMDRLDLQNMLFSMTISGALYVSPLQNPLHCLDVGTGTGIWAMDFADAHPGCEVIGIDLSPIQPTDVPPNLTFLIDDCEETWHYRHPFDLIHSRMMVASLADWPKFFAAAFANLRPGGWLENQDVWTLKCDDDSFTLDPPSCSLARWWNLTCEAVEKIGRSMVEAPLHKRRMIDAGFVDVTDETYKWPINTWPKDEKMKLMGLWSRENTVEALEALAMAPLTRILGWEKEEVQVLVAEARKDVMNRDIHAYWSM
ncbi:methyltransferase domain-containing protein [Lophium mytilinum]|uniref:Methyltransferase domain-containing protein n=1 Tax=Lophium mytilinum TaxID=390894 RepID=A0A6A6QC09_9PEZI|nr:methyltransferase domain-containing protein [Lophium mytilinum]